MMFGKKPTIGPAARASLRRCSPFATLLLDLCSNFTAEEVENLKLVVSVDRQHIVSRKRKMIQNIQHGAAVLQILEDRKIIEPDNLEYLEYLFLKWGRKDLITIIDKYHQKRLAKEQTVPKCVEVEVPSAGGSYMYTKLKMPLTEQRPESNSPVGMFKTTSVHTAELYTGHTQMSCSPCIHDAPRAGPSGSSFPVFNEMKTLNPASNSCSDENKISRHSPTSMFSSSPCDKSSNSPTSSQESQMSVDDFYQCSQMSISDDDKACMIQNDSGMCCSPMQK